MKAATFHQLVCLLSLAPLLVAQAVLDDLAAGRGGCQLRRAGQVADELQLGEGAGGVVAD
ncbi:hypothetical protein VE04_02861, partial [Pseudogymnoascus sp. 24MN13]